MSTDPAIQTEAENSLPALVFLSGRRRGKNLFIEDDTVWVIKSPEGRTAISPAVVDTRIPVLARLERAGATYLLHNEPYTKIWVNGREADTVTLRAGDIVKFGENGPVMRFRLYPSRRGAYKTVSEAVSDCVESARQTGKGRLGRAGMVLASMPREMATRVTPTIRIATLSIIVLLVAVVATQIYRNVRLEQRLDQELARSAGLADLLEKTEEKLFSQEEFQTARSELEGALSDTDERVRSLEALSGARARVIGAASKSVVFIQGGYGFLDQASKQPLRFVVDANGRPQVLPNGEPMVTIIGAGPEVEVLYTGTAFIVSEEGLLLTNRHVALPWESEPSAQAIAQQGFEPVMRRFIGFLPGRTDSFDIEVISASDSADVAVLRCEVPPEGVVALEFAERVPSPGEEVVVLGFPTGMSALMARADEQFVRELLGKVGMSFWELAEGLSEGGYIAPLATQGIVGQVTLGSIVYDAETTHGGSGGPVIGMDGLVLAVNSAVIPEFGGSNLGVPAREAIALLSAASTPPETRPEQAPATSP